MSKTSECVNCGATLSTSDKECKYCGSKNPDYSRTEGFISSFGNGNFNEQNKQTPAVRFNVGIFVLLFIIFWPAAIIYLIVSIRK